MKKMYIISAIIVGFTLSLAIGVGLGIRISQPKEEKEIEYCKTCPMCGWRVELMPIESDWYIECQNIDCDLHTGFFHNKEELIEKWNKMCEVEGE